MPRFRSPEALADYIRRQGRKTLYISKDIADLSNWNVPSIGPRGSILGMRRRFWGEDAIVAKQGDYYYKLAHR